MFDVRQALVRKYDARFPESDVDLQRDCAQGNTAAEPPEAPLRPTKCPGNRRWIQLMFDSFLLQPSATSMLDARDAFLAADQMRFGGRNQKVIWTAFAKNGMGEQASTVGTEDDQPMPDYTSPLADEGTFVFSARAMDIDGPAPARERQALPRPVRGAGHAGGRHRPGDGARRRRGPGAREVHVRHAGRRIRVAPVQAHHRRQRDDRPGDPPRHERRLGVGRCVRRRSVGRLAQREQADRRHRGVELGWHQPGRRERRHRSTRSSTSISPGTARGRSGRST